jgi:ABC-type glycerol-3-phosphate transport system permease component
MAEAQAAASARASSARPPGRRVANVAVFIFFLFYTAITLLPIYLLFIRTFISTKDATDVHLWIPQSEAVSLDAEIGNLSVFYNLNLDEFKREVGIPDSAFLAPRDSLRDLADTYSIPTERIEAYFSGFSVYSGWRAVLRGGEVLLALGRTLVIALISLIGLNILSMMTGYGLAGLRRPDQMVVYNVFLLQMVLPPMLIILPQFLVLKAVGLTGTYLGLILVNIEGGALSTMIYTSFISAFPRELEDCAEMDGATRLQYLVHVLIPNLKVPFATLTAISLPQFWNQFLQPYVYLDRSQSTLLPLIQNFSGEFTTNFQIIYTAIFVSVLPLLLVYLIFRRLFVAGQLSGAIKG